MEWRDSNQYGGPVPSWVFKFRYTSSKTLSFYGYSAEGGDFFSGYGDYGRLRPANRRYYGYQIHGLKGWRKVDPFHFDLNYDIMLQPVTHREFTIDPGIETEVRFNPAPWPDSKYPVIPK